MNELTPSTKKAEDIQLAEFRQIFIWPLVAASTGSLPIEREIENLVHRIGSPWRRVQDPLRYLEPEDDGTLSPEAYQEFVYFHGYVQRFLFDKEKTAIRIFKRSDIRELEVQLKSDNDPVSLRVDRLHLYLFTIGVATLVVETSSESLNLADALTLGDYTRRAYPPFWYEDGNPGLYPLCMRWVDENGAVILDDPSEEQSDFIEHVHKRRRAPVAGHWRTLFPDSFVLEGYAENNPENSLRWRHVVDERMPTMTFIATNQVKEISRGDWVRLCFVDEKGTDPLPYAEPFLEGFEAKHAYDRFWGDGDFKSRILISGYGFATVSDAGEFSLNKLKTNFRRHYFQMGLVLHFQMAALLAISDGLSQAVAIVDDERGHPKFAKRVEELRQDLLHFSHRYWFTGLSNHIQGRELYELWRNHLGLKTVYDEVAAESRETDEYLQAKNEADSTKANVRLTEVATFGLFLALAIGFLGINVIIGKTDGWTDCASWVTVAWVVSPFCIIGAAVGGILKMRKFPIWTLVSIAILCWAVAGSLCYH